MSLILSKLEEQLPDVKHLQRMASLTVKSCPGIMLFFGLRMERFVYFISIQWVISVECHVILGYNMSYFVGLLLLFVREGRNRVSCFFNSYYVCISHPISLFCC